MSCLFEFVKRISTSASLSAGARPVIRRLIVYPAVELAASGHLLLTKLLHTLPALPMSHGNHVPLNWACTLAVAAVTSTGETKFSTIRECSLRRTMHRLPSQFSNSIVFGVGSPGAPDCNRNNRS